MSYNYCFFLQGRWRTGSKKIFPAQKLKTNLEIANIPEIPAFEEQLFQVIFEKYVEYFVFFFK